jgi:hypothetical protein
MSSANHITGILPNGVQTVLHEKAGTWVTTCPACGKEYDVGYDVVNSGELPVCCSWAFRLFDRTTETPTYTPRWEFMGEILKEFL